MTSKVFSSENLLTTEVNSISSISFDKFSPINIQHGDTLDHGNNSNLLNCYQTEKGVNLDLGLQNTYTIDELEDVHDIAPYNVDVSPIDKTPGLEEDDSIPTSPEVEISQVGLGLLPNQKKNIIRRKGASFTMMVIGARGTGKTTFINSLFGENIIVETRRKTFDNESILIHRAELTEKGFTLKLTAIESSGFGDSVDNRFAWSPAEKFISEQFRLYCYQEEQPERSSLLDSRVHCCLYFITPTRTNLSSLDKRAIKQLSELTNLIPIIAKSDTYTKTDLKRIKSNIHQTMKDENISICEELLDQSVTDKINRFMPFAIISSNEIEQTNDGRNVRGRKYDWGVAEIENIEHCDFVVLREILMGENMLDLIFSTDSNYESFRRSCLIERFNEIIKNEGNEYKNIEYYTPQLKLSGLEECEIFHKLKIRKLESKLHDTDQIYIEKEKEAKLNFANVIQAQEKRFKEWKRGLFDRQEHYNKGIEKLHLCIIKLQEEIEALETGSGSLNNSLGSLSFN
ncbi:sporulation-regulated protein 3 [[Candida] anglica]